MKHLITAGELAKLANTTKRTIQFYDQEGILTPVKVNESHYRLYDERQILDYQMILLLCTLGVSLNEIKKYLKRKGQLVTLFEEKKPLIRQEVEHLQFNLTTLDKYLYNLRHNGTMTDPRIEMIVPFEVYYIEKVGPYSKIDQFCKELSAMFATKGKNFTTLSIFYDQSYQPRKSRIKICALAKKGMKIKEEYKNIVKKIVFNPGKVLTYTYHGSGTMLSLFWKELEKYCKLKGYVVKKNVPDFEIYWKVSPNVVKQKFQIYLPIE